MTSTLTPPPATDASPLMRSRRFAPLFWTQFGGAFSDNYYKSALLMLFTYGGLHLAELSVDVINNLVAMVLMLPFLIVAPLASQYADKFEKARLMRALKLLELALGLVIALALWLGDAALLVLALCITGVQSACFSPFKYAILPQHVTASELVAANGLLHMGTTFAIFLGLIVGSAVVLLPGGEALIALGVIAVALLGYWASRSIPEALPAAPELRLTHNPLRQYWRSFGHALGNKTVFWSLIGIGWFWLLGAVYLTQVPNFVKSVLGADKSLVPTFLLVFSLGVCLGALLATRISRQKIEPGLMPLGALLVSAVGFELGWAAEIYAQSYPVEAELIGGGEFFARLEGGRVLLDFALLGAVSAVFIVPLSALLQARTRTESRAQVIGASNVINALFMIAAGVGSAWLLGAGGCSIIELFELTALANLLVLVLLLVLAPEFGRRFGAKFLGLGGSDD